MVPVDEGVVNENMAGDQTHTGGTANHMMGGRLDETSGGTRVDIVTSGGQSIDPLIAGGNAIDPPPSVGGETGEQPASGDQPTPMGGNDDVEEPPPGQLLLPPSCKQDSYLDSATNMCVSCPPDSVVNVDGNGCVDCREDDDSAAGFCSDGFTCFECPLEEVRFVNNQDPPETLGTVTLSRPNQAEEVRLESISGRHNRIRVRYDDRCTAASIDVL